MPHGADTLLGPDAGDLLEVVLDKAGIELGSWRVHRVHRHGTDTLAVHYVAEIDEGDGPRSVTMVGVVSRRQVPEGATVVRSGPAHIHLWRWPYDPYLPGLPAAVTPSHLRALIDRLDGPPGSIRVRTRSYRPTRRAVIEVGIEGRGSPAAYLKVMGGRSGDHLAKRTLGLADIHRQWQDLLPVPRVLGVAEEQGIVALSPLAGTTLRQALVDAAPPDPSEVVDLARRISVLPVSGAREPMQYADPTRHAVTIGDSVPDEAERAASLAKRCLPIGGPVGSVHGDFHDAQVLVRGGRISGVLDIDGAGTGPLALDAGRIVAWTETVGLAHPDREDVVSYADRLADAFTDLVPPAELARSAAAAWIGLATGPHRQQLPDPDARVRERLDRAEAWLDRT